MTHEEFIESSTWNEFFMMTQERHKGMRVKLGRARALRFGLPSHAIALKYMAGTLYALSVICDCEEDLPESEWLKRILKADTEVLNKLKEVALRHALRSAK